MLKTRTNHGRMIRKTGAFILIAALTLSLSVGCGQKQAAKTADLEKKAKEVVTEVPERGLRISVPQQLIDKGVSVEPYAEDYNGHPTQNVSFYYKPITDKLFQDMQDTPADERTGEKYEEFYKQVWSHSKPLLHITMLPKEEYQKGIDSGKTLEQLIDPGVPANNLDAPYMPEYSNTEQLGENGDYIYLVSIPECKLDGMGDDEKKLYEECKSGIEAVKKNIEFISIKAERKESDLPDKMPAFSAVDLNGNKVTEDIFKQKDITMVNVWGTFCAPCIEEMPALGEMARSMPENVQMVGYIVDIDGDKNLKAAQKIVSKANAGFTQIVADKAMSDFTDCFVGVPATFFVDKDGNILGKPIVGGTIEEYQAALKELLK